jgi:hypothetical protein
MTLVHFDDSAEAQLVADELRSENQFLRGMCQGLEQRVSDLDAKVMRMERGIDRLVQLLTNNSSNVMADASNLNYEMNNLLSDLRNQSL